jgi:hypothetical protein
MTTLTDSPCSGRRAVTTTCLLLATACLLPATPSWSQTAEPKARTLSPAADPVKKAVLIGRVGIGRMKFEFFLEGAEAMWMQMGTPPMWGVHQPDANERYHVELKLSDSKSRTRIPYANVLFTATHKEAGTSMSLELVPMWGDSGLHYSANSALLGDGSYAATVTVDVPTFQRELKDKDLWPKPISAKFHFRLKAGKLVEVSQADR